jgi:hypothetical protein
MALKAEFTWDRDELGNGDTSMSDAPRQWALGPCMAQGARSDVESGDLGSDSLAEGHTKGRRHRVARCSLDRHNNVSTGPIRG